VETVSKDVRSLQIAPNPADASTVATFTLPSAGQIRWTITDALGREVYSEKTPGKAGLNTLNIGLKTPAAAGVYRLVVQTSDGQMTGSFSKI
jgi:hypothetical protein